MHQFEDIGRPGFLRVRDRSCHRCTSCWEGNSHECTTPGMEAFPAELVELDPYTMPERPVTRSALSSEGMVMARTADVHDFVAVEIDSLQEPWMIGQCTSKVLMYEGEEKYTWMGKIIPGDEILWAHKLEGTGNTFTLTDKLVPVFVEDVRHVKFEMRPIITRQQSTRSTRTDKRNLKRFELSRNDKSVITQSMPLDVDVASKSQLRKTFFD